MRMAVGCSTAHDWHSSLDAQQSKEAARRDRLPVTAVALWAGDSSCKLDRAESVACLRSVEEGCQRAAALKRSRSSPLDHTVDCVSPCVLCVTLYAEEAVWFEARVSPPCNELIGLDATAERSSACKAYRDVDCLNCKCRAAPSGAPYNRTRITKSADGCPPALDRAAAARWSHQSFANAPGQF